MGGLVVPKKVTLIGEDAGTDTDRIVGWVQGYLSQQQVLPSWAALKDMILAQFPDSDCDTVAVKAPCQALLMEMAASAAPAAELAAQ